MNKTEVQNILNRVSNNESVNRETLRVVAKAVGVKTSPIKKDLENNLRAYVAANAVKTPKPQTTVKRGRGRPKADPSKILGYKVKVGLRYPNEQGVLVTNMKEGALFKSVPEAQKVVDDLVKKGDIRVWGGTVRAQFLPRYG